MRNAQAIAFSLLLLAGCQSGGNNAEKLEMEVMKVHDEVMPRMDELMDLKSQISTRISRLDSLAAASPSASSLDSLKQDGIATNQALAEADSLMMTWMNQYNPDTLKVLDEAGAVSYLSREKEKIGRVKEKFSSSIERAKKYLQSNP
ncbi:viral A-type inclusion protein [Tellurirhabdus rosea]|uniref:viral A-type inclusion protein n=1 Tax=Tellurirhabdus rosea TaxID=2674997 RepID=UPI002253793B|nr:viral A-type inclusion protein [Tellurirhabdus rosea]